MANARREVPKEENSPPIPQLFKNETAIESVAITLGKVVQPRLSFEVRFDQITIVEGWKHLQASKIVAWLALCPKLPTKKV